MQLRSASGARRGVRHGASSVQGRGVSPALRRGPCGLREAAQAPAAARVAPSIASRRRTAQPPLAAAAAARSSPSSPPASASPPARAIDALTEDLGPNDTVLLWYRDDLRTDDHPGLRAAADAVAANPTGRRMVPLYVIDPQRLSYLAYIPGGPEALAAALDRLRAELRALGSDLVVRQGPTANGLADVATAAAASSSSGRVAVVSQGEVELSWRELTASALEHLAATTAAPGSSSASGDAPPGALPHYEWDASVWPAAAFQGAYREWAARRGPPTAPLPPPTAPLPPLPPGLDPGPLPSAAALRAALTEAALAAHAGGGGLAEVAAAVAAAAAEGPEAERAVRLGSGPTAPLELLRQYLGTSPTPSPAANSASSAASAAAAAASVSIDEEVAALRRPGVEGAPFTGLFATAKALGTLSARRVMWEAYAAAKRPYGSAPPRRLSPPAAATAAAAAESADFHRALAAADGDRVAVAPGVGVHYWRWRGGLTDYCSAEPARPLPGAPAVLLVHGFGAFGEQWRDNMAALAAAGYRVFAPTFPGFGRSQKAALPYGQELWRDFLRDFTLQVVGAPVVLAGNSIGGYISTCLAADYPSLVRGLVLLNSAGPVDASFSVDAWRQAVKAGRSAPPAVVVGAVSSALFWYLERTVPSTLKWLYPTNPAKADAWLQREILRAAGDSGAIDVFKAVWYLPPPRALNYLVGEAWRGPTLVLQGALDPLNDAKGRAQQLAALCPNVRVQLLQAGHCPHDEVPEQVNEGLLRFIREDVAAADATSAAPAGSSAAAGAQVAAAGAASKRP